MYKTVRAKKIRFLHLPFANFLFLGKSFEIFSCLWNGIAKQTDFNATSILTANGHVKVNLYTDKEIVFIFYAGILYVQSKHIKLGAMMTPLTF